jgi:hypothetical protein
MKEKRYPLRFTHSTISGIKLKMEPGEDLENTVRRLCGFPKLKKARKNILDAHDEHEKELGKLASAKNVVGRTRSHEDVELI